MRATRLGEALASADVFTDGDWVESKDQDPNGEVRLVQLADVGAGHFLDKSERFLNLETAIRLRCTFLSPGDVLVARMPDPIGRACIFPGASRPSVTVVDVCVIRCDEESIDNRYLAHMLNSVDARTQVEALATGSTRSRISRGNLANVGIPVPALTEQRRIAAILDHADTLRAKGRQVLAHLDTLTQSVFEVMFEENLPSVPLGELADTRLGKMLDAKKQTGEHLYPYLRNANVQWFRLELDHLLTMDFSEKDRSTLSLLDGDVLMCEGGQPGRSAIWRGELKDCYFQKALHRVRLGSELDPEYFVRAVKRIVDSHGLKDYVTSSTISHLTGEKLRTLPIPLPPLDLQRKFVARSALIATQYDVASESSDRADSLFRSLQSRAFRGQL